MNSLIDHSERNRAVDAPHESEERYRTLVELTEDAVLILVDNRIRYCNPAGLRLLGVTSLDAILNHPVENFNHPEERELAASRRRKLLETGVPVPARLFRLQCSGRRFVEVESSMAMCSYQGRPAIQMVLREASERIHAENEIRRSHQLLDTIRQTQERFLVDSDPRALFENMLNELLILTESEYGFIGEVLNPTGAKPYLKMHAITNIAWDDETRAFFEKNAPTGLEFTKLESLFGSVMLTGHTVIANDPATDPRRGGLPPGHPALRAFLGLPFHFGDRLVGMVGLANRPNGYDEQLGEYLQPVLSTCAHMIESIRSEFQRRQSESALKQSEARFRAIFEAEPQCIKLVAADGRLLEMNAAGMAMIAARELELVQGHCVFDLVVPEDREAYMSFHRSICMGAKGTHEFDLVGLDGRRRHMYSHAVPFQVNPSEMAALSITLDLTERRRAEEALRLSEAKYRTMFDNAVEGIFQTTPEGKFLTLNATLAHIYGFDTPRQAMAHFQNVGEQLYVNPSQREEFVRQIELNGAVKGFEFQICRKDGNQVWVRESARAVHDSTGRLVCYEGTVEDITERKRAEQALGESEERYRLVVEGSLQGILIHQEGRIRYANAALAKMFDYDGPEELIGRALWETFVLPESIPILRQRTQEILDGLPIPAHPGWRGVGKHGREIWVATAASRIELNGQGAVVAFYLDITERVHAEEARRKLEAQFHHSQKLESLGVLAGGIAHDFNNLLTAMLGYASLARLSLPPDSRAGSMLEEIEKAGQRAAELAHQMLAYSGKGKFVLDVLELDHVVGEMARLLETVVSKKAALHLELQPARMEGDPTQIRQVVMNLITNASDALGGQTGAIVVHTGVRMMQEATLRSPFSPDQLPAGAYSFVEVKDSGCGMSAETLLKIFDPFFTTKFTGRGLGLAAVLGIVRGHKGTILVESVPDSGTTFQIYFPSFSGKVKNLAEARTAANRAKASGTVLVVEDEESIRHLVSAVLNSEGYDVLCAIDGREGMRVFGEHRREIVLVLLDMTMPHMGGIEVLKQLRHRASSVPVVLMSGFSETDTSAQCTGLDVTGFLQKPFRPVELLDMVRKNARG